MTSTPRSTDRLALRPWRLDDAAAALEIFGRDDTGDHLEPVLAPPHDLAAMRALLRRWVTEGAHLRAPAGRWAVERVSDRHLIGGAFLLPLPPGHEDLEVGWRLTPSATADGYAGDTMFALASFAFGHDADEVFAVVRPQDAHVEAAIRQNGMRWVGDTTKYHDREMRVFRLRQADLDPNAPTAHRPPELDRATGAR